MLYLTSLKLSCEHLFSGNKNAERIFTDETKVEKDAVEVTYAALVAAYKRIESAKSEEERTLLVIVGCATFVTRVFNSLYSM